MTAVLKAHGELSPAMEKQYAIEQEMFDGGIADYRKTVTEAKEKGREAETQYGNFLLRQVVEPVAEAVEEFLAKAKSGRPGRRHAALPFLVALDADRIALLAAREIINSMSREVPYASLATAIAGNLEDEVRFGLFSDEAPGMFVRVSRDLNQRTSNRQWKRTVLRSSMRKLEIEWEDWPQDQKFHVGSKCIDLFIQATGLVEVRTYTVSKTKSKTIVRATEETAKMIEGAISRGECLFPRLLPMVVPPKPWTRPRGGGYHFLPKRYPLIKNAPAAYLEELGNMPDQMAQVYEAVNIVQDVAWKINQPVLDALLEVWDRGLAIGKLPRRENEELPARPVDIETNEEARKEWRREASKVHDANARSCSTRVQVAQTLSLAKRYSEEEAIYFPWQLDFRGRAYTMPSFLSPQASDFAKALLCFAEGKPIEDERALGWLMIHGANCWGEDKVSLDERIRWVEENEQRILCAATDPLADRWWTEADDPFSFLAFCFEYAAFQAEGWGYVSHLPVAMDGSCNGLQHFSAMLRDEVGGAEVNLVPSEEPHDIYQKVADVVVGKLRWMADARAIYGVSHEDLERAELARQWLSFGVDRQITKRPVMVLPYGGTHRSCRTYVADILEEKAKEKPCPWDGDHRWEATVFLSTLVWESIGEVVIGARSAMGWLRKLAAMSTKAGLPITWTTPDGLPVRQSYRETRSRRIETKLGDRVIKPSISYEGEKLNPHRQRDGISPNFVHSMDAAAMRLYVTLAYGNGVESFALIHDSFGVLAADAEVSAACLRHAFVDMYKDNDVLAQFRQAVLEVIPEDKHGEVPVPPTAGSLDLEEVRHSPYFFA